MRAQTVIVVLALILTPLGARAADLVVSWQQAHHAQEDKAIEEVIAAFEHDVGKQVELSIVPMAEQPAKIEDALEAGRPPDFAFGFWLLRYFRGGLSRIGSWISRT